MIAIASVALSPLATAAEPPEIETNYSAGKAAIKAGKLDDALRLFKTALSFSKGDEGRTWQMLLAIALTYKERAEPQYAIEYYRRFLKQTDGDVELMQLKWKKRREIATRDLSELERMVEATHGFVAVSTKPRGALIMVDGKQGGADGDATSPFGLILPAGPHTIFIAMSGHEPHERKIDVRAGGAHPVKVTLKPIAAPSPPPVVTPKPDAETPATPTAATKTPTSSDTGISAVATLGAAGEPIGAWVTIGTAGALAIAGVAMTVMASEESKALEDIIAQGDPGESAAGQILSNEYDATDQRMQTYDLTGSILYGLAVAAAAGGIVWLLLAEPDDTEAAVFGVTPTDGGAHGHATWRF